MSGLPRKKDGDVVLITHARTIPTTSVDDALLYLIIITGVVVIIFNMENTPSIGESYHINKLLDYLTIINLVKKYSGENWKRFLGMLVKTSDEIKEILK